MSIPQRLRLDWVLLMTGVTALTTVVLPHSVRGWSRGYGLLGATLLFACALIYWLDKALGVSKGRDLPSRAAVVVSVAGTVFVVIRTATLPGGPHARILIALSAGVVQLFAVAVLLARKRAARLAPRTIAAAGYAHSRRRH